MLIVKVTMCPIVTSFRRFILAARVIVCDDSHQLHLLEASNGKLVSRLSGRRGDVFSLEQWGLLYIHVSSSLSTLPTNKAPA